MLAWQLLLVFRLKINKLHLTSNMLDCNNREQVYSSQLLPFVWTQSLWRENSIPTKLNIFWTHMMFSWHHQTLWRTYSYLHHHFLTVLRIYRVSNIPCTIYIFRLMRDDILASAVLLGVEESVKEAKQRFHDWMIKGKPVSANLREVVYTAGNT